MMSYSSRRLRANQVGYWQILAIEMLGLCPLSYGFFVLLFDSAHYRE